MKTGQGINGLIAFGALDDARRAADQLARTHVWIPPLYFLAALAIGAVAKQLAAQK